MSYEQSIYKGGEWLEVEQPILGSRIVEVIYNGIITKGGINVKNPFQDKGWVSIIKPNNSILRELDEKEIEFAKRLRNKG